MATILEFPVFHRDIKPDKRACPLPQGGTVRRVAFRELDKLEECIEEMYALPEIDASDKVGDRGIFSDGEVVSVLEIVADERGRPVWVRRESYDHDVLIKHLNDRQLHRRRLERKVRQLRCDHDYNRQRRCTKCNAYKPIHHPNCRSVPSSWSWKTKDGAPSRFKRMPRCRRRLGHEGDCSWVGDPGCTKNASWRQPTR